MQAPSPQWVGIDVGKETLAVTIQPRNLSFTVPNTAAGHRRLLTRIGPQPSCIVLEATGRHHLAVQAALVAAGQPPAVINPLRVHYFRKSEGLLAKTDGLDATVLASFAEQKRPAPAVVRTEVQVSLTAWCRHRDQLVRQRDACRLRRNDLSPLTRASHDRVLAVLEQEIATTTQAMAQTIAADPGLAATAALLTSVPGIGAVTAAVLLAELPELGTAHAKAIASLAGVAPRDDQSGKADKPKRVTGGRPRVRRALYLMAVTTVRWDPAIKAHYAALRARGKAAKVALMACARKVLGVLNAMVREGITWQQTQVGQGRFLPPPP
jgi:transposase